MIIGLKNLKVCEWMSEESNAFQVTIVVDGKDLCHAKNDGKGGCTTFYACKDRDYKEIDKLNRWCIKNLPKWTSKWTPGKEYDRDLEFVIDDLVERKINETFEAVSKRQASQ
jgi:hypothetical protein